MNTTSSAWLDETMTTIHAQRACFAPSNRELMQFFQADQSRGLDGYKADELAIARVVFAQVALMAGAALVADSETYFGAEQIWRDMQDKIGPQERALAKHFLEILSQDDYYTASERKLIGALSRSLPGCDELSIHHPPSAPARAKPRRQPNASIQELVQPVQPKVIEQPTVQPPFARLPIKLDDATVAHLRAQRDSFAPSNRELMQFFQADQGRGLDAFKADELAIARVVFAQVALMTGAALAADTDTYVGAEQLWCDMQEAIGPRERMMARRFLDLLSRDAYYTDSERQLIASLAAALPETEDLPLRVRPGCTAHVDSMLEFLRTN